MDKQASNQTNKQTSKIKTTQKQNTKQTRKIKHTRMKQLNNKYIQLGKILNQTFVYLYHLHQDQRFGPIFSCVVLLVISLFYFVLA
jgi:hypothetical protein